MMNATYPTDPKDEFVVVAAPNPPMLKDEMMKVDRSFVLVSVVANPQSAAFALVATFARPSRVGGTK